MAPNEIWQLSVIGTVSGTQHIHTLHFRENDIALTGTMLLTAWLTSGDAAYRACFAIAQPAVQLLRAAKVCGTVPLPAPAEYAPVGAQQLGTRPTSSSEPMPAFLACLVNEKTAFAGRRYTGRFFMGGLLESDCIQNTMQAPYLALVQAYVDALKAGFVTPGAADWKQFVFSRLLAEGRAANTPGQPPEAVEAVQCQDAGGDVVNMIVSNQPTTMRSRKLGSGL